MKRYFYLCYNQNHPFTTQMQDFSDMIHGLATTLQKGEVKICPVESLNMKRYFYLCYNQNHPFTTQMQDFSDMIHGLATTLH